jgi:centrosomal protein CEP110
MKTEEVQKIIQRIKDTLLFILDLYHEQNTGNDPADKQLKKSLLNQLTSACYILHEIFFDTTLSERMQLIRKDRDGIVHQLRKFRSTDLDRFNNTQ